MHDLNPDRMLLKLRSQFGKAQRTYVVTLLHLQDSDAHTSSDTLRPLERGLSAAALTTATHQQPQPQQHLLHSRTLGQQNSNISDLSVAPREPSRSVEKLLSPGRSAAGPSGPATDASATRRAPLLQQASVPAAPRRASYLANGTPKKTRFGNEDTAYGLEDSGGITMAEQDVSLVRAGNGDGMGAIPPGGTTPQRAKSGMSRSKSVAAAQSNSQPALGPPISRSAGSMAFPGARSSSPMALRLPRSASGISSSPTAEIGTSQNLRPTSPSVLQQMRTGVPAAAVAMMKEGELIAPPSRRHLDPRLLCMSSLPSPSAPATLHNPTLPTSPAQPELHTQVHPF